MNDRISQPAASSAMITRPMTSIPHAVVLAVGRTGLICVGMVVVAVPRWPLHYDA